MINLITWKSMKQTFVSRSNAKVEYRAMTHTSCKVMQIEHLLVELRFDVKLPMTMYCGNQVAIHTTSNPISMSKASKQKLIVTLFLRVWKVV